MSLAAIILAVIEAVLAIALGFALKWSIDRVKQTRRNRIVRDFFGLNETRTLIIHSAVFNDERKTFDYPACDTSVARIVATLLESVGIKEGCGFIIRPDVSFYEKDGSIRPEVLQENLVLICGPKRNRVTKEILDRAPELRYTMTVDSQGNNELYDTLTKRALLSSRDRALAEGIAVEKVLSKGDDYGLILSFPNPFNLERRVVVLAGVHGTATLGVGQLIAKVKNLTTLVQRRQNQVIQEVIIAKYREEFENVEDVSLV